VVNNAVEWEEEEISGRSQTERAGKSDSGGQARFSLSGPIPASARRHSTFRAITHSVKDTRPLSSKEYQNKMVRKVYDFLLQHDGENCMPERVIRSPTRQDFIYMFESIYQHLSPDFQLRNVNDEVPAIFRELGYPNAIRTSTMQTVGASHTWPHLLGALTWLIEVVEISQSLQGQVGQNLLLGGDDSDGALNAYKYSWLNAGYKKYQMNRFALNDEDFLDDKVAALRTWCEQQQDDAQEEILRAVLEEIEEECNQLEADKGNVERLCEDIARLDDDIMKAALYSEETEQDLNRLMEGHEVVETELNSLANAVSEERSRLSELETLTKAQEASSGLCSDKIRELKVEHDQNQLIIRKLKDELEHLSEQYWLVVPKNKIAFAEQHDRYHKLMLTVKNLHYSAQCGVPLVMENNVKDERALLAAVSNVKTLVGVIEAAFVQRKFDIKQVLSQSATELESVKQEYNVLCGRLRERQRMESRADRQRRREREKWEKALIAGEADLGRLENEKEVLEDKRHEVDSLKWEIERQKAENTEQSRILREKQLKLSEAVLSRFRLIVSDLDLMKEAREWMMRTMKQFCEFEWHIDDESA
ncbi:hypothetical protein KIN20_000755, partial [Parelaphostrongylus tenuis]